ncbi:MAG: hypothetical protein ABW110_08150, partial [Steroidobacteraceae bacterium]
MNVTPASETSALACGPQAGIDAWAELNHARAARVALILLTLTNLVNYIDRMLMPALAQPIKQEFGLSDAQV